MHQTAICACDHIQRGRSRFGGCKCSAFFIRRCVFAWRSGHIATIRRMHHIVVAYRGALRWSLLPVFLFFCTAPAAARLTYICAGGWGGDGTVSARSLEKCVSVGSPRVYVVIFMLEPEQPPPPPPPSLPVILCISLELRLMGLPGSNVVMLWNPEIESHIIIRPQTPILLKSHNNNNKKILLLDFNLI